MCKGVSKAVKDRAFGRSFIHRVTISWKALLFFKVCDSFLSEIIQSSRGGQKKNEKKQVQDTYPPSPGCKRRLLPFSVPLEVAQPLTPTTFIDKY